MAGLISVAVMAHPKRAQWVPELVEKLDADPTVVWDRHNDRWETGRRSMLAFDPDARYHLVIQDDAIVPRNLVAGLERAIEHCPRDHEQPLMMGLYVGRTRPYATYVQELADKAGRGTSWLTMSMIHWGVGILAETRVIPEMIEWGDRHGEVRNYDTRIGTWCQVHGIPAWYPWPSLVDHRISPSLIPGRRSDQRYAHSFIGEDADVLRVEWSATVAQIGALSDAVGPGPFKPGTRSAELWTRRQRAKLLPSITSRPRVREGEPMAPNSEDTEIMQAAKTAFVYDVNNRRRRIVRGVTTAHAGHRLVREKPQLWEPVKVDYAVSDDVEKSEAGESDEKPLENLTVDELETVLVDDRHSDLGQVREWAEAQGIELKNDYVTKSVLVQYLRA